MWPGLCEPDSNPTEQHWSILRLEVEQQNHSSKGQRKWVIREEWQNTFLHISARLVPCLHRRIKSVVKDKNMYNSFTQAILTCLATVRTMCMYTRQIYLHVKEQVETPAVWKRSKKWRSASRGTDAWETCLSCKVKQCRLVIQKIESERCFTERHWIKGDPLLLPIPTWSAMVK